MNFKKTVKKKFKIWTISLVILSIIAIFFVFLFLNYSKNETKETILRKGRAIEIEQGIDSSRQSARYKNQKFGFSFEKPENFTVGAFPEGEMGEMILVQIDVANIKQSGFQIFINPIPPGIELTPQFIQQDLPGTEVRNPKEIILDGKAKGIMFFSNNESFNGDSREIWFIYNDNVYQATSYAEFSSELERIIGTWKFQ